MEMVTQKRVIFIFLDLQIVAHSCSKGDFQQGKYETMVTEESLKNVMFLWKKF
jgi:hypothetical protein